MHAISPTTAAEYTDVSHLVNSKMSKRAVAANARGVFSRAVKNFA